MSKARRTDNRHRTHKDARYAGSQSPPHRPPGDSPSTAPSSGTNAATAGAPGLKQAEAQSGPKAEGTRPDEKRSRALAVAPRSGPGSNQLRSSRLGSWLGILALATTALFIATAVWFYEMRKLNSAAEAAPPATTGRPAATAEPPGPAAKAGPGIETLLATQTGELKEQTAALRSTLDDLQKRLAASEKRAGETARQVAGLATLVEDLKKAADKKDAVPAPPPATVEGPPDSLSDLVLLKERNRLTAYADEAIATGARGPYERLWDAFEDPRLANLVHAARAEILRVQDCYINGQRVKFHNIQQHQIPVAEIFPDSPALAPAQLSDDQLIRVLQDLTQTWQTRVKAAWHLGQRRNTKVGDALVKAIKTDPVLDVAAEATFSFEQITGYHAKLFEVPALEAWWKSYNEKPRDPKTAPMAPQRDEPGVKTSAK